MVDVLSRLGMAVVGALFGLYLNWVIQRRAAAKRLDEYRKRDPGGWQAWQRGFYDIRDWASMIGSYLRNPSLREIGFDVLRIPGPRYLDYLLRTGRIPHEHFQQALILSDYCQLLSDTLAHVLAGQWLAHQPSESSRALPELRVRGDGDPTVELARAVEDMARDLADPARARREQRRAIAAAFAPARR